MKHFMPVIAVMLLCATSGCDQTTEQELIQDGATAATVAAVLTLESTLPLIAPEVINGLNKVTDTALKVLSFPGNMLTVEQLINLDIANGDPNLARYQAIINFALPILNRIPGISAALNTPIDNVNGRIRNDLYAFFKGIQAGLGQPSGTTIEDLIRNNPRVAKAVQQANLRDFDVNALRNALLQTIANQETSHFLQPQWGCVNGHCPLRSGFVHSSTCPNCQRSTVTENDAGSGEWYEGDHGEFLQR